MAIFRPAEYHEYSLYAQRPDCLCYRNGQDFGKNHAGWMRYNGPPTLPLVEDTHVYPENYRGAHVIKPQMTALVLALSL